MDLRHNLRLLRRDRAFTLTTVATLAVCIAANTAIFAIVHTVLLKPLPFDAPDRLVTIYNSYPNAGAVRASNGVPDYFDRLAAVSAFEQLAMYRTNGVTIGGAGAPVERVTSMPVTPSFFPLLGVETHRGRVFTDQEGEEGQNRKAVLSYGLWQRLYGGADSAIGRELRINGVPSTIVGVLPQTFQFIDPDVQLWTAAAFSPEERSDDRRHSNNWQQLARLAPDATVALAQSQIDAVNNANLERFPQFREILTNAGFHTRVKPFHADLVESTSRTLWLLWGGVLLVMLIGAVNLANLASVRATTRARELATRHALGASFGRLARQVLTESMVLALVGGGAGLGLGWLALGASRAWAFEQVPRASEIGVSPLTVAMIGALVALVGLTIGLFPVFALRRADLAQVVREEGRSSTSSRATLRARRFMVTAQVAVSLVLLVGAGLLFASFQRVLAVDTGFNADQVITGTVSLPATRYADGAALRAAATRLLEHVTAVPGVTSAGLTTTIPLSGQHSDSVILAEGYQMSPGESLISPSQVYVSSGYFEAMQTTLVRGRLFDDRDVAGRPRVIIVDERLATKFWSGQDPVGRRMYFPSSAQDLMAPPKDDQWFTVVGVVENVRIDGLVDGGAFRTVGAYYMPLHQSEVRTLNLAVRTALPPDSIGSALRAAIATLDPELPLFGVRTMNERVDQALLDRRTPMLLALGFAVVALLLAVIGVYGVLAYQVSQRSREIGIRLALGADAPRVFAEVLKEGAWMVGGGVALGLIGAVLLRSTLQTQLHEVGALDPRVIASVAVLLTAVALLAMLIPARRAAAVDPVKALS